MIMTCSKIWGGFHTLTNLNLCNETRALKYLLCQLFSSIVSSSTHTFFEWDTIWERSESVSMSFLGASKSSMEESILFFQYSFIIYSSCWTILVTPRTAISPNCALFQEILSTLDWEHRVIIICLLSSFTF